jgi:hypothetical protein
VSVFFFIVLLLIGLLHDNKSQKFQDIPQICRVLKFKISRLKTYEPKRTLEKLGYRKSHKNNLRHYYISTQPDI